MVPHTSLISSRRAERPRSSRNFGSNTVIPCAPLIADSICGSRRSSSASASSVPTASPSRSNQLAGTCCSTPSASQRTAAVRLCSPGSGPLPILRRRPRGEHGGCQDHHAERPPRDYVAKPVLAEPESGDPDDEGEGEEAEVS